MLAAGPDGLVLQHAERGELALWSLGLDNTPRRANRAPVPTTVPTWNPFLQKDVPRPPRVVAQRDRIHVVEGPLVRELDWRFEEVRQFPTPVLGGGDVAVSPDGLLWVVERDEHLVFANPQGTVLTRTPTNAMITGSMQFSRDGGWLVAFHADQGGAAVALYRRESASSIPFLEATLPRGGDANEDSTDDGVAHMAFSKTGRLLAVQDLMPNSRQTLSVYEVATQRLLWSHQTESPSRNEHAGKWLGALAFSEDESTVFAGPMVPHERPMSVAGWSAGSGAEVWRGPREDAPRSLAFARDRLWIETADGVEVAKV